MDRHPAEHVETLVIGGGQSGLAIGYWLRQRGHPFLILDSADRIGDPWRHRWDSLRLFTPARYDQLPGLAFPGRGSHYPTKDEVADYLEAYAATFQIPVRAQTRVDRLTRRGDAFEAATGSGSITADNVVIATGMYRTPKVPDVARSLEPGIVQLHSRDYRRPDQLQAGPVLIVGAGNSGAEIALDVASTHKTYLSGRDTGQEPTRAGSLPDRAVMPLMWFAASRVLSIDTPIGRKARDHFLHPPRGIPLGRVRRKDLAAAGIERVRRIVGVRDGRPLLDDDRAVDVDTVIWCTGFHPDLAWVELPIGLRDGYPDNDHGAVASQPGLYVMGMAFQTSLSSALLGGVGRDAARIVHEITNRARGRTPAATSHR
jgi:putative flavoprotein involved in K+ transport